MKQTWAHLHLTRLKAGVADVISIKVPGEKIRYSSTLVLHGVTFKVHESGRQRTLKEGTRNVHAWVVGNDGGSVPQCFTPHFPGSLRKAIYDPFKGGTFVDSETLSPIHKAEIAILIGKDVFYN